MSTQSSWGTIWAAVGALAAVAGVMFGVSQVGAGPKPSPTPSTSSPTETDTSGGFAATVIRPDGGSAYVFASPSTLSAIIDELPDGTVVTILCTVYGEAVSDNGMTSALWNWTTYGFIPDVSLGTGTVEPVMPPCT